MLCHPYIESATTLSVKPAKDLVLVHTVQLKLTIKTQVSGRMISSGINYVAFVSIYFDKTSLRRLLILLQHKNY